MADRPFQVIEGGGKPEPDSRIIDALEEALARAKAGEFDGLLIVADVKDDEPESWLAGDDPLVTLGLSELMFPALKAAALGYE